MTKDIKKKKKEEIPDQFWETPPKTFEELLERLGLTWMYEEDAIPFAKETKNDKEKKSS